MRKYGILSGWNCAAAMILTISGSRALQPPSLYGEANALQTHRKLQTCGNCVLDEFITPPTADMSCFTCITVVLECFDRFPDPQDYYGVCAPECESSLGEVYDVYEALCGDTLSDDTRAYVEECVFPTVPQVPCTFSSTTDDSTENYSYGFTTDDSTDTTTYDSFYTTFDTTTDDSVDPTTDDLVDITADDSFDPTTDDSEVGTTTDDSVDPETVDPVDPTPEEEPVLPADGNGVRVRAGGSVGAMVAATVVTVLLST